jgi:hypothetical protein
MSTAALSKTDLLSFTPTVGPFFINRESHENRESFGDATYSPLQLLTTICTVLA